MPDRSEHIVRWNPLLHDPISLGRAVVAIGIFDGLHLGHRALLSEAADAAEKRGVALVVLTFEKDPDEVFCKDDQAFGKLLENQERLEMLAGFTGGTVVALPADRDVFNVEPDAFLDALEKICTPVAVFVGDNFRFGHRARGTVGDLRAWSTAHGCACEPRSLIQEDGATVSSTRIRALLKAGHVGQARKLLAGRAHAITGRVVHGRGEGTGFGIATANLDLSATMVVQPKDGVYGGYAIVDGAPYAAAINMGVAKSFEGASSPLEAHLLDFGGDLYGKSITIVFVEWLRESRVFDDQDELIRTIQGDIAWVRENLGEGAHGAH